MAGLRVRVLGPVAVDGADRQLAPSLRRMLAVLVSRPGLVAANDLLVEAMWPDGPPSGDGLRALRTAASRLRQVVGAASVEYVAPGYRLMMAADEVDAWAFEATVAKDGSPAPVEELARLDKALALWRGGAFEEFADEAWALGPAGHLEELRTAAGERRLELLVATGRHQEAVAEAARFAAAHPYRDGPRLVLLSSLAATGRQAEALRAYQEYREEMAEAGLDPGAEVQALERQLAGGTVSVGGADAAAANHGETTPPSPGGGLVAAGTTTTMTVLFTDLVGSTALLSRVGQVRADELRRAHFALLRDAVRRSGGREVKNLGDGLMVVFERAADGLACAIAMQQAQAGWSAVGEPLSIRVGIAGGEVEVEGDDCFGVPVVEAARLCAKASGDEILLSEGLRLLARGRGEFRFDAVGGVELKGFDEPVVAHRLRWEPVDPAEGASPGTASGDDAFELAPRGEFGPMSLPSRLVAALSGEFVGRSQEHERLENMWDAVVGGERRAVLLAGEPGIGKTTLAARSALTAHEQGGVVLYGRCDEGLGVPYQPWVEALGELVRGLPIELLAAHVAARGPHLARLVPELGRRTDATTPTGGDGDAERFVLFGCVVDLLERTAELRPVLIVLDDLHWADLATTHLLRHIVSHLGEAAIGVVGTYRDSDVHAGGPLSELLVVLHRERGTERLSLTGLTDVDLTHLMERIGGHGLDRDGVELRDALLSETAGNPFFVGEVLRHLAESGAILQDSSGRWVSKVDLAAVGLPESVREVIGQRVARLGGETERLLTFASVVGRDFDVPLLAAVSGTDESTVIDSCDLAVAAAVLRETGEPDRYTFTHALIEHTLFDSLSAARRSRVHRAVAEAIEAAVGADAGPRAGELAHHWGRATGTTDAAKAARYAQLAGDRAQAQSAPDEAIRWYGQALELTTRASDPAGRHRAEQLLGLGIAQRQTGVAASRETLLEAAHLADAIDDIDLLVRAVLANSRGFYSGIGQVDEDRLAIIDRALERQEPTAYSARAQLLALAATERTYLGPLAERLELAVQAVGFARQSGDPATCARVFHLCMLPTMHPSTLELRTALLDEACAIVAHLDDPSLAFWVHQWSMLAALERADGAALEVHSARSEELAERVPDTTIQWNAAFYGAWLAGVHGDPVDFEARAEAALQVGLEGGQADAFTMYGGQLLEVRYLQGRLREMVPFIEQGMVANPGISAYRSVLALALADGGEPDAARDLLTDAAQHGFETEEPMTWSLAMACWAEAAVRTGAVDVAPVLRDVLCPYHEQIVTNGTGFLPSIAHHLGRLDHLLGAYAAAEKWFAEALDLHARVGAAVLVAQTQVALAALLADQGREGDGPHARELAQAALVEAVERGYGTIEDDARAVLSRLS